MLLGLYKIRMSSLSRAQKALWSSVCCFVPVVLFSLYPVLRLYAHNASMLTLSILIRPIVFASLLAFISYLMLLGIYRRQIVASVAAVVLMILLWNYSAIYDWMNGYFKAEHWHTFPIILFLYAHLLYYFPKITTAKLKNLLIMSCLYIAILSMYFVYEAISAELKKEKVLAIGGSLDSAISIDVDVPDIYLIILDEYARFDTIKEEFGYDNSNFNEFLHEKGFFVAKKSEVRYLSTVQNLASFFNFEWISVPISKEELLDYQYSNSRETTQQKALEQDLEKKQVMQNVVDNRLMQILFNHGYQINVFSGISLFYPTLTFKEWDEDTEYHSADGASTFHHNSINEFEREMLNQSFFVIFDEFQTRESGLTSWELQFAQHTLNTFRFLSADIYSGARKNDQQKPKFKFAHIMSPHNPYVFDRHGGLWSTTSLKNLKIREDGSKYLAPGSQSNCYYTEQYIFVTNKLKEFIDSVFKNGPPLDKVILILSDHGPRPHELYLKDPKHAFKVLNALYLPEMNYENHHKHFSPIDTLRYVFSKYFGEEVVLEGNP
jgi:hypothetical protein